MNESILTSIKKLLGITAEYTHFESTGSSTEER